MICFARLGALCREQASYESQRKGLMSAQRARIQSAEYGCFSGPQNMGRQIATASVSGVVDLGVGGLTLSGVRQVTPVQVPAGGWTARDNPSVVQAAGVKA
jgi:hypothetical protein